MRRLEAERGVELDCALWWNRGFHHYTRLLVDRGDRFLLDVCGNPLSRRTVPGFAGPPSLAPPPLGRSQSAARAGLPPEAPLSMGRAQAIRCRMRAEVRVPAGGENPPRVRGRGRAGLLHRSLV